MDTQELLADAFGRIKEATHAAAAGLSAESLAYRPDPDANSIGWLVWHLARVQDDHVADIAGRPQAYVEEGWANRLGMRPDPHDIGFGHTTDQAAAVRFADTADVLAYFDAVHDRTLQYLASIDANELDRIIDERWDPPVSVGVRLISVVNDCLQHAGQAAYVRGMLERQR